jgi:methionyl-tRNA formyltransferase
VKKTKTVIQQAETATPSGRRTAREQRIDLIRSAAEVRRRLSGLTHTQDKNPGTW